MKLHSMYWAILAGMLCHSVLMAQSDSADSRKKVETGPEVVEQPGVAQFGDFEMTWAQIETHQQSSLRILGKETDIRRSFSGSEGAFFTPIEEQLAPGRYTYQIEFTPNEASKIAEKIESSASSRRQLLAKRLELLEQGDRQGAKRLMKKANAVRSQLTVEQKSQDDEQEVAWITRQGVFIVKPDGSIKNFDLAKKLKQDFDLERKNREKNRKYENAFEAY